MKPLLLTLILPLALALTSPIYAAELVDPTKPAKDVPNPAIVVPAGVIALERASSNECPKGTKVYSGSIAPPTSEIWCQSDLAPPAPPVPPAEEAMPPTPTAETRAAPAGASGE